MTEYGLLTSATSQTGREITYGYDSLGRKTTITDPIIGNTVYHYDGYGRIDYIDDPKGVRTQYTYESETGRKKSEINGIGDAVYYEYNTRDQVVRTWGTVTPVEYVYDDFGRMSEMHTSPCVRIVVAFFL